LPTTEGPAEPTPLISIVVTVRNEERNLPALLESLLRQDPPFEIIVVDAFSTDRTWEILVQAASHHPDRIRVFQRPGHRGEGRNQGSREARGTFLAFTDGDCIADSRWLRVLRSHLAPGVVVAGETRTLGEPAYAALERVELYMGGMDVTYPSCNLAYPRELFERLGGFDPRFITAEDIDLNLRAVRAGALIRYAPEALIYHHARPTLARFLLQAFWNGYGRKQLTEKHGHLWSHYRYERMFATQRTPLAFARLAMALTGYFTRILTTWGSPQRRLGPSLSPSPGTEKPERG
jgi:glycosyltransferase involved in cell wall biosynthesis